MDKAPYQIHLLLIFHCLNNLPSEAMRPELLPSPESASGTRVSSGLGLAFTMLKNRPGHRTVVLLSDGDDPAPDEQATLLAASMAATGIQLVVIPVGQALPESIPTSTGWPRSWHSRMSAMAAV